MPVTFPGRTITRLAARSCRRTGRLGQAAAGGRDDRGAVGATVGLLLGSGVLLGMAALVVDVGLIYAERAQLQAGADAAAIAVAQGCAVDPADCSPDGEAVGDLARRYADGNANDGQATAEVCGTGTGLDGCPSGTGALTDCLGEPPGAPYVEVRTGTRRDGDETLLPPVFAHAVVDGYEGARVGACARAAWGGPSRAAAVGLALPYCDWRSATGDGAAYPTGPAAVPVETGPGLNCSAAGFRWLDTGGDCRREWTVGDEVSEPPARPDTDHGCGDVLADALDEPVLVPVVDRSSGPGAWTVRGFAAFVVTGWTLPGHSGGSRTPCGADACVHGHLTTRLLPGGGAPGGPDLGARVVTLIG